jgi:prevent-host-death family protein
VPPTLNLYEAKTHLSALVDEAASGQEIIIAKAAKPLAKLVPFRPARRRRPGLGKGTVWMAHDFDAPLPDDVLDAFEGEPSVDDEDPARYARRAVWHDGDRRLPPVARRAIERAELVLVSAASGWEVALKPGSGKLRLEWAFDQCVSAVDRIGLGLPAHRDVDCPRRPDPGACRRRRLRTSVDIPGSVGSAFQCPIASSTRLASHASEASSR